MSKGRFKVNSLQCANTHSPAQEGKELRIILVARGKEARRVECPWVLEHRIIEVRMT